MITVHLPSSLASEAGADTLTFTDAVPTVGDLVDLLATRLSSFGPLFDDALINVAVNDEMLLHGVRERTLADGDVVELIPTISGGCACRTD